MLLMVEAEAGVIAAGARHAGDAESLERPPVVERDRGVDERRLHQIVERLLLRFGQFGADVRDHHVPRGEHAMRRLDAIGLAAAPIMDLHARTAALPLVRGPHRNARQANRSEEHTSELQSLMRISYAVFCLKKKKR